MKYLLFCCLIVLQCYASNALAKDISSKCTDLFSILPSEAGAITFKLKIMESSIPPKYVYNCIGRSDINHIGIRGLPSGKDLRKGQVLKLPKSLFNSFSPWGLMYEFSFGSIDSTGPSRSTDIIGRTLYARHTRTVNQKYDLSIWAGLKMMGAHVTSDTYESGTFTDVSLVGKLNAKFNYNGEWAYYLFADVDRYAVSNTDGSSLGELAFIYKIINGVGGEKRWGRHFISRFDAGVLYPGTNNTNLIKTGGELGAEIEFQWKKWMTAYRLLYFNYSTGSGFDSGYTHSLSLGRRF